MKKLARVVCVAVALMAAQSALAYVDAMILTALGGLKLLTGMSPIPLFGTESTVYGLQLSFFPDYDKDCGPSRSCETKNIYGGAIEHSEWKRSA